jgi:hypothetical protein
MTRTPDSFSRITWFTRSILTCMTLKSGIALATIAPMKAAISGMMTTRIPESGTSSRSAMMMPPTAMIGAEMIMFREKSTTIWICWTSFVLRVMSDGAPKMLTSCCENVCTLPKMAARTSRPKAIAVFDPQYVPTIAAMPSRNVMASIIPPVDMM